MSTKIVLTGILKDDNELLIVKRSENDDLYPGAWEFPGGHLEDGCIVNSTCELVILTLDEYEFSKYYDEETGYNELLIKEKK